MADNNVINSIISEAAEEEEESPVWKRSKLCTSSNNDNNDTTSNTTANNEEGSGNGDTTTRMIMPLMNEGSVHDGMINLAHFQMKRVLDANGTRKLIFVEGTFKGYQSPAVVILEKKAFPEDELFLKRGFFNEGSIVRKAFRNDVYGDYECFPTREHNGLKTTIIHPATQKHIDKFLRRDFYIINETYENYKDITLPYLEASSFSLQWIDNIFHHKAEYEKIMFEDKDAEKGFVLMPDLKWDGHPSTLMVLAIARKRIKSLRELNDSHLPLLKNIRDRCSDVIMKRFKIPASQLRIFLHYQPSYYHLHVHFSYLNFDAPGIYTEKAHLLANVISNIELMPDYYQKVTLPFSVKEDHPLWKLYKDKGLITVIDNPVIASLM